jgi:hypothetical protein
MYKEMAANKSAWLDRGQMGTRQAGERDSVSVSEEKSEETVARDRKDQTKKR